jgi:hypothetical protein
MARHRKMTRDPKTSWIKKKLNNNNKKEKGTALSFPFHISIYHILGYFATFPRRHPPEFGTQRALITSVAQVVFTRVQRTRE